MTRRLLWALALVLIVSTPAFAQLTGGVRAGVSGGPTQFVFGGHVETRDIVERLTFRPNVEIGVGDDVTIVAMNIEFAYWLPTRTDPWRFYLGAGPAALIGHSSFAGVGNTEFGGGFNFLGGVTHTSGLFFEMKGGVADSPDFKFLVGYTFKR
jgi:hypothetical protein